MTACKMAPPMFHPRGPSLFELARQALSSTERGYDLLAPKFDFTPFRTPDEVLAAAAEVLGGPGSLGDALDLCCGTGAALAMLRPLCRRMVVGVDFSLGMLAEAHRQLTPAPGLAPVELLRADVLDLAELFAIDGSQGFDVVTCFGALGHFRRRHHRRLLTTVARCLRPGGRFVFATSERPPPWSWRLWLALAFDTAMAIRNAFWRPPFVMYYLSWLLTPTRRLLEEHGFSVTVHRSPVAPAPWLHVVEATIRPPRS